MGVGGGEIVRMSEKISLPHPCSEQGGNAFVSIYGCRGGGAKSCVCPKKYLYYTPAQSIFAPFQGKNVKLQDRCCYIL